MNIILVVDDYAPNLNVLSRRLERVGYGVLTATDGEQAVRVTQQQQPDLVLMDMSLPVKDGWAATREIKSAGATENIPVIGITAFDMLGDRQRVMDAGCDDFAAKPVNFKSLLSQVEKLIARSR